MFTTSTSHSGDEDKPGAVTVIVETMREVSPILSTLFPLACAVWFAFTIIPLTQLGKDTQGAVSPILSTLFPRACVIWLAFNIISYHIRGRTHKGQ